MTWSIYRTGASNSLIDSGEGVVKEHLIVMTLKNLGGSVDQQTYTSVADITGYMKKPFSYSTNAQYSKVLSPELGSVIPKFFGNLAADYTQRNLPLDAGYLSKKIFDPQASYLKLDLEFRIYDDPSVVEKCDLLATCCWPIVNKDMFLLTTESTTAIGKFIQSPSNILAEGVAAGINGPGKGFGGTLSDVATAFYDAGVGAYTTKMPPHVDIKIGTYFEKMDMVISNVDITFSTEFTRSGRTSYPTFADISITVESIYGLLGINQSDSVNEKIFGSGFKRSANARSRVVIDQSNSANFVSKGWDDLKSGFESLTGFIKPSEPTEE